MGNSLGRMYVTMDDNNIDYIAYLTQKLWHPSRKERRRMRQLPDIIVGLEEWNRIKANPSHPFHRMQKRQIRRAKLLRPWRSFVRWFRRITGIERRYHEKFRKQYPLFNLPK